MKSKWPVFYNRFSGAKPDDRMQFQTGAGSLSGDGGGGS